MRSSSAVGIPGAKGLGTAPSFQLASIALTSSIPFGMTKLTKSLARTPTLSNAQASRLARASRSPHEMASSPHTRAMRSGSRSANSVSTLP